MRRTLLLVCLLALGACAHRSDRAAVDDHQSCTAYGFQPGTPEFANCLMQLDITRRNGRAMNRATTDGVLLNNALQPNPPLMPCRRGVVNIGC
jgi:hypothetical protein